MSSLCRSCCAAFVVMALSACGSSAPPPKAPTPAATVQAGPGPEPAPDLSPVAAPADLVVVGRLKKPSAVLDTVIRWAKLPIEWRRELAAAEPAISELVEFDAPIDLALSLDPKARSLDAQPFFVVSIGLRSVQQSLEVARRQGENVERVMPGVYRVGKSDACLVAASVGPSAARLVCGDRPQDVEALLPYVTRGLPKEDLGAADLHIEMRAEALRRRFGRQIGLVKPMARMLALRELGIDDRRFDDALADAVSGIIDELVALLQDVDRATLEVTLRADSESANAALTFDFRGASSWTVQALKDSSTRASGPSELFFRLPKDANVASWSPPPNPKRYDPIRKTLAQMADGLLTHEKVSQRVRDQLTHLVEDTLTTAAPSVYAQGEVSPAPQVSPAPGTVGSAPFGAEAQREGMRRTIGWYVVGIDAKSDVYKRYFDELSRVYNDAQLRKMLETRLHLKAKQLFSLKTRATKAPIAGGTVYELTLPGDIFESGVPAPASKPEKGGKLDKGGKPDKGGTLEKGRPLPIVLVVVPDGARTWLGLSADETLLTQKLASAKKGDAQETLASREGLAALRSARAVSGGFLTVASFTDSLRSPLTSAVMDANGVGKALEAMPNRGRTPMPYVVSVTGDGGTRVSWSLTGPRAVFEDVGALLPLMSALATGGRPPTAPPRPAPGGPPLKAAPPKPKKK